MKRDFFEWAGGQRPRLWGSVAALAVLSAACVTTYDGGGIVANHCIGMTADYEVKNGDKLQVGVGDLSISNDGAKDSLNVQISDGRLKIKPAKATASGSGNQEHLVALAEDRSYQVFEEQGDRVTFNLGSPQDGGLMVLHLVKTCPEPKPSH